MIDFYTWNTPNGQKVAIMLEELQVDYKIVPINIRSKEQFKDSFLKINPNNKIPAITDVDGPNHQPISIFESGAILIYLAEKTGRLLPSDLRHRYTAIEWLMFQMSGIGPMGGQLNHFLNAADEQIPYAINRYREEVKRLYAVMDNHLKKALYFAGEFSIADIAIFPWVNIHQKQRIDINDYPNIERFIYAVAERPAVQKAMQLMQALN